MKAVRLEEPGRFCDIELPEAEPSPGEALVAIRRIGMCGTDWHALAGHQPFFTYPRILGHELAVEVLESPDTNRLPPGTLCALEPYYHNPQSQASRLGKTNCCEDLAVLGVHIDGGMRERLAVPIGKLHPRPGLSLDDLALVETLGIGAHAVHDRARVTGNDRFLVIGAGPIGLGVTQFASMHCPNGLVIDTNPDRLAPCNDHIGCDTLVIDTEIDPEPLLREKFDGELPTVIFDCSGNVNSMNRCPDIAAHGGRIVYVGLFQGEFSTNDLTFHRKELSILSSRNATSRTFDYVMDALESGPIAVDWWITHRMKFADASQDLPRLERAAGLVKLLIDA